MPGRIQPLVTGEIYHVFNLGIAHGPTFTDKREYLRAKNVLWYYRFASLPVRFSYFSVLNQDERVSLTRELNISGEKLIDCLCFCFMPNHFHFLVRQVKDNGISKFMSNFQNSYTRYFNTKNSRLGQLFLDQFKATRIETEEQLLHISRYIHLNPYTAYVVKTLSDLETFPWSSLGEYFNPKKFQISESQTIVSQFKTAIDYKKFVFDQADYQRQLDGIKHLTLEG
ncbi:MAG: transposase [Candidatus Chisholmbacteria bacterium]|nr:transposase [Candidatus Chisholmbacteria bacterium]